jgi:hypothetical protein
MSPCRAATARAAQYSLTKPSPTLSTMIAAMIAESVKPPVNAETTAAPNSSASSGLRNWTRRIPNALTGRVGNTLGPELFQSRLCLRIGEPGLRGGEQIEDLVDRPAGRVGQLQ